MKKDKYFRIVLLFNANKVYDRQVVEGVGEYLQASQCHWDVFIEEDFRTRLDIILIIGFVTALLQTLTIPLLLNI